ncbi:MAG TPA: hypothetical protein VFI42_03735 [Thermomicrobiaceae bacterium]|nr:hypothetical protein [Thermomicrobiaceae bacterium]
MPNATTTATPAIQGNASGVLVLTIFGTVWGIVGAIALNGWGSPELAIVVVVIGIVLLAQAVSLRNAAARLPDDEGDHAAENRRQRGFIAINVVEFGSIAIAVFACNVTQQLHLLVPLIALIVGLHFLPLAALFHVRTYYVTGVLLCLLAVLGLFAIPSTSSIDGREVRASWAVVSFGAAVVLWASAIVSWLRTRTQLRERPPR